MKKLTEPPTGRSRPKPEAPPPAAPCWPRWSGTSSKPARSCGRLTIETRDIELDDVTHFIGKPYTVAELTRKVREVLDS